MSKTFPHINYQDMDNICQKCKVIVEDLENMIPEDCELGDLVDAVLETASDREILIYYEGIEYLKFIEFNPKKVAIEAYNSSKDELHVCTLVYNNIVHYDKNHIPDRWKTVVKSLQSFIDGSTDIRSFKVNVKFQKPHLNGSSDNNYHRTIYNTAKKILKLLKTDTPVNTLNLELSAALQFLEELSEGDWKQGLKPFKQEELEEIKEIKKNAKIEEVKSKADNQYEEDVEAFKKWLNEKFTQDSPSCYKESEYSSEKPLQPEKDKLSFWQAFKNTFKF